MTPRQESMVWAMFITMLFLVLSIQAHNKAGGQHWDVGISILFLLVAFYHRMRGDK